MIENKKSISKDIYKCIKFGNKNERIEAIDILINEFGFEISYSNIDDITTRKINYLFISTYDNIKQASWDTLFAFNGSFDDDKITWKSFKSKYLS